MMQVVDDWAAACWCGLLPLMALALWHSTDVFYRAAFALTRGRRRRPLPPGHMGVPLLGESLALMWYFKVARRPDGFLDAKKRAYGEGAGMYRTHLLGSPTVLVCSPAINKFVLQSPESFGSRWPSPEIVGASSVSNVEGRRHARLRGFIVAAVNQPGPLRTFARVVQPRIAGALNSWADRGTITAATEIKKVLFENICKIYISMDPSPLTEKMDKWFAGVGAGLNAHPLNVPGTTFHHALKCRKKLNALFREELEVRRRKNKATSASGNQQDEEEEDQDLMSALMRTEDDEGKKLTDEEVVDSIVSLVLAGYESTSNAIMWAAYHLAKSPHVLAKLREETAEVRRCKSEPSSFMTYDDIPKMKYTSKIVEETIRLANIAPMLHRVAHKDVEYGGYTIPKGWKVVVWLHSLHTDPKYYKDPLKFNPDRWDEPAKPGTYQAFGVGYRVCAGHMLARLQITIMLYHLSLGYEWKLLNPDSRIVYLPTSRPEDGAGMAIRRLGTRM